LNISAPPLSMRLPWDALLPHCPSTHLESNFFLCTDADVECVSVLFLKPCIHHLFRPNGFRRHFFSKSLVLLSNDQRPVGPLQLQLHRMASLMEANAFVHQFKGSGVSRDAVLDPAATAECVLADYVGVIRFECVVNFVCS
jgi:hypothetical protein